MICLASLPGALTQTCAKTLFRRLSWSLGGVSMKYLATWLMYDPGFSLPHAELCPMPIAGATAPHLSHSESLASQRSCRMIPPIMQFVLTTLARRSEERRVGKECRSGGWRDT